MAKSLNADWFSLSHSLYSLTVSWWKQWKWQIYIYWYHNKTDPIWGCLCNICPGFGSLQMKNPFANSGTLTATFINVHCPCKINPPKKNTWENTRKITKISAGIFCRKTLSDRLHCQRVAPMVTSHPSPPASRESRWLWVTWPGALGISDLSTLCSRRSSKITVGSYRTSKCWTEMLPFVFLKQSCNVRRR